MLEQQRKRSHVLKQSSASSVDTTMASSTMTAAEKLSELRKLMKEHSVDIYLVPSDDPHLSGNYQQTQAGWKKLQ